MWSIILSIQTSSISALPFSNQECRFYNAYKRNYLVLAAVSFILWDVIFKAKYPDRCWQGFYLICKEAQK